MTRTFLWRMALPENAAIGNGIRYGLRRSHVPQYIDLHCHLLPGLDDGAPDLATSMEMLRELLKLGFTEVCVTPHQRNGLFIPSQAEIAESLQTFKKEAAGQQIPAVVRLGAENYWDEILIDRLRKHSVPCYEDSQAFLFEVNPVIMPPRLEEALFEVRLSGYFPVVAHPERYVAVQRDLEFAENLAKQAAMVVDLEAVAGDANRAQSKAARRLIEEGLAHAAASDMHRSDASSSVAKGIDWMIRRMGNTVAANLLQENPRRILSGELP